MTGLAWTAAFRDGVLARYVQAVDGGRYSVRDMLILSNGIICFLSRFFACDHEGRWLVSIHHWHGTEL